MPWRYDAPPSSDFCREFARRKVGKSVTGRLSETARRVDRLEAVTVFDSRQPRGLYIYNGDGQMVPIDFDSDGRLLVTSSDGSVSLARYPWQRKSVLDIVVGLASRCFSLCSSVTGGDGVAQQFKPVGYLQLPKDNGDGTCTCVAVPYMTCNDGGDCGQAVPEGH